MPRSSARESIGLLSSVVGRFLRSMLRASLVALFALLLEVVVLTYLILSRKEPVSREEITISILIPTLAFLITKLGEGYLRWKPVAPFAELLLGLGTIPEQLKDYVTQSISNHIRAMHSLSGGGGTECTYAEQIAIADNLVLQAKRRLWTTTLDAPSRIWKQGYSYFLSSQARLEIPYDVSADPPNKARIVVLDWDALKSDLQNTRTRESFEDFVQWHKAADYGLRFLAETADQLRKELTILYDSEPMMDFMIVDQPPEFAYGRSSESVGGRVRLRFIRKHEPATAFQTLASYESTFVNWWHLGKAYEEILERIRIESDRFHWENELVRDYGPAFESSVAGPDFFVKVCDRIRNSTTSVAAVDIADSKASIDLWSFREEYLAFSRATRDAASAGKLVERIFVVNATSCLLRPQLREALRTQVDAGIKLYIITKDKAQGSHLQVDDFLLVDDDFGFYLGSEPFDMNQLGLRKNLIPKDHLRRYRNMVDTLKEGAQIKILSSANLDSINAVVAEDGQHNVSV